MDVLSPRTLDTLRHLGLTEYAARCYVALLGLREAEASDIAEAAEVPRTKAYAALKDLADGAWVVALGGRPVRYKAVAPAERIAQAERRIVEEADAAARELQARFDLSSHTIPMTMYLLRGREVIDARARDLLGRTREELFVNVGFAGDERILAEELRKARRRGVKIALLLGPGVDAQAFGEMAAEARPAIFPYRGIIVDWRQALIEMRAGDGAPVALWNTSEAFLSLMAPVLRGMTGAPGRKE